MLRWGLIGLALLLLSAAPAWAEDGTTTTPTVPATTTVVTTTTATTTTAPTTTTAATTTAPAPATTAPRVARPPAPSLSSVRAPLQRGCPAAAVVVVYPKQMPLFLAPPPGKALLRTRSGITASVGRVDTSGCSGSVLLRSLSLFGSIAAQQVRVDGQSPAVVGLRVGARSGVGRRFPLGWGTLVVGEQTPAYVAALTLTLSRAHEGLPAGTRILVGVGPVRPSPAVVAAPKVAPKKHRHHRHHRKATHKPLKVTPKLEVKKLVFPLVGGFGVGDSYGGQRTDVPGGWHHGDDLFAPIGTPVVAVASGTVNRVGWEHLGGWRLWVRDTAGDQFYYAHLSGYAPAVMRSKKVTRGEVIGFVGNTGDAFQTPPHLHFEVHPRRLLHLGYDGAVDPTTYLDAWPHVSSVVAPHPVHPPLPRTPLLRSEASYVWRELLVARHLIARPRPKPSPRPGARLVARHPAHLFDAGVVASAARAPAGQPSSAAWPVVFAGIALVLLVGASGAFAYRRQRG